MRKTIEMGVSPETSRDSVGVPNGQTIFLIFAVTAAVGLIGWALYSGGVAPTTEPEGIAATSRTLAEIPIDGARAYRQLQEICRLGPRPSGSPGMAAQQELLISHFEKLQATVSRQEFTIRHPQDGTPVKMTNLIAQWYPERAERVLLCAHYDTRPYPDQDPDPSKRRGIFIGANDGGSGVAVLAEIAHHLHDLSSPWGVDIVLFDGEEFVFDNDRDKYFHGSEYFAREYATQSRNYRYRWGVLLDMVGDTHLEIYQERNSVRWPDTRPLVDQIWQTARRLGVREFIAKPRHEVLDDHVPLHEIGKIPTCDIIDFDYRRPGTRRGYWHTTDDTPDKCSPLSLAKVGWVVLEWLRSAPAIESNLKN